MTSKFECATALLAAGAVPWCDRGDVEYLDMARFGDALEVRTWWSPGPTRLGVHQSLVRTSDERELVRATGRVSRWLGERNHGPDA